MKHLMIVDCDCGVDDAMALLLALAYKDTWQLLAVTCCYGNTTLDNVCNNVRKVLQFCNELEIPVYKGCDRPLIKEKSHTSLVHGGDGFGNVGHEYPHDRIKIAEGHAANALVNLAKTHRQDVHLVVLGPMTNVALAHRLDPEFTANLKSIHFMGGNIHGIGNTTAAAEFNFSCDPEAANIVVTESKCPVTMVPWETTANHGMSWDFYESLLSPDTDKCRFLRKICNARLEFCKLRKNNGFLDCDFLAMAALLQPAVVKEALTCVLSLKSDGQFAVECITSDYELGRKKNVNVVSKFDDLLLNEMRKFIVHQCA